MPFIDKLFYFCKKNVAVNQLSNQKILVTGGAGFIGSNLVDKFLKQNNRVVCLDNFATGKRENLADALKNESFKLLEGDIRNAADCQRAVEGVSVVFHQAALGSVPGPSTIQLLPTM